MAEQKSTNSTPMAKMYLVSWMGQPEYVLLAPTDEEAEAAVYRRHHQNVERGTVRNWSWQALPVVVAAVDGYASEVQARLSSTVCGAPCGGRGTCRAPCYRAAGHDGDHSCVGDDDMELP